MDITVLDPIANKTPMEKMVVTYGLATLIEANAVSPSKWATNIPSTKVYRLKITIEHMDGMTNLRYCFNIKITNLSVNLGIILRSRMAI